MKIEQGVKEKNGSWDFIESRQELKEPLVLVFGNRYALESNRIYQEIRDLNPKGQIVFGTTSGEILENKVYNESIVLTAIEFEKSMFKIVHQNMNSHGMNVEELGHSLIQKLPKENLKHTFIISEGTNVNGSGLIKGLEAKLNSNISISGGLCGDDARFERTLASYNENPKEGEVVCIGFYGDSLEIAQIISNAGEFSKYLIAGDAKGIASCYTADGKIFSNGIDILEGTKDLEEYWAPGEGAVVSHHKITPEELRIIGDYAHDYGYYEHA